MKTLLGRGIGREKVGEGSQRQPAEKCAEVGGGPSLPPGEGFGNRGLDGRGFDGGICLQM